ncbi:MAG: hypothetical protein ACJAR4_001792 [Psychroserpens sp.]|jgi:hypothetical protein
MSLTLTFSVSGADSKKPQFIGEILHTGKPSQIELLIKEQSKEMALIKDKLIENQNSLRAIELQSNLEAIMDKSLTIEHLSKSSIQTQNTFSDKLDLMTNNLIETRKKIEKQNSVIGDIQQKINENNFYSDYIHPIVLSVIAAIIFWLFFSYLPEERRAQQLRKKISLNFLQIYNELFTIVDMAMKPNSYSPSYAQQKIITGTLEKQDIFIALQNKCLNESYLYDQKLKKILIPIGKELHKRYSIIDMKIESIFHFSSYLSSDEILLLEEIRTTINTYGLADYEKHAGIKLGTVTVYPVNPSLSYMSENIFKMFNESQELFTIIAGSSVDSRDVLLKRIMFYFYNNEFEICKKIINKSTCQLTDNTTILNEYLFACELELDNIEQSKKVLNKLMLSKPNLVSSSSILSIVSNRSILSSYIKNKYVSDIFRKHYSELEVEEMNKVLSQEANFEDIFLHTAKQLKNYYENNRESEFKPFYNS